MNEPAPAAEARPTPRKKLHLDPELPLRAAVGRAAGSIVAYAQDWGGNRAKPPERRVHEFRKSVRRSRALVKFLRGLLSEKAYAPLADGLRAAVQPTSPLRDTDALLERVENFPRRSATRAALDALEQLLRARQAANRASGRVDETLDTATRQVATLPAALDAVLPRRVKRKHLREALETSFRKGRKTWRAARKHPSVERVHTWRKRVKELRYQLELLRPLTGELEAHALLATLAEDLGAVNDLAVLAECVERHAEQLPAEPCALLLDELNEATHARTGVALVHGERLFARKPRAFARGVLRSRPAPPEQAKTSGEVAASAGTGEPSPAA